MKPVRKILVGIRSIRAKMKHKACEAVRDVVSIQSGYQNIHS